MIPITLTANSSYTLDLGTNSAISDGTTSIAATANVALGGFNAGNGQNNPFGKGEGGSRSGGPYIAFSGSGYGAGGGGGPGSNGTIPSGGGGGFNPNAYYGLATDTIPGVPVNDMAYTGEGAHVVGEGKPAVLFLELTKQ
jgi:hypothetical protein